MSLNRLAAKIALLKNAGPLTDVSHLRYQAVFTMGAPGSGKSFYANKTWLNYLPAPGGAPKKYENTKEFNERIKQNITKQERSQSNLDWERGLANLTKKYPQYNISPTPGGSARTPFRLYEYDNRGREILIPQKDWKKKLPRDVYEAVEGLTEVVFDAPIHEVPSYWRQVNPDIYKEELSGYLETQPGFVHEMSSEMSKAYFEAAIISGDPLIVDGTGANLKKMKTQIAACKAAGYSVSLVWIYTPLVVNLIRNATRARVVNSREVTRMFGLIRKNFEALMSVVDKAEYVNNSFDKMDKDRWKKKCALIDQYITQHTGFQSDDNGSALYNYVLSTPYKSEVLGPYKWVKYCKGGNPILEREDEMERRRERRDELLGRTASISLELYRRLLS